MDLQFQLNNYKINVKATGIIIKDNKVLLHQADGDSFWGLIGGRIKANETSKDAVIREYKEELGIDVVVKRLLFTSENFFNLNNEKYHEFHFIYLLDVNEHCNLFENSITRYVDGCNLTFKWVNLDNIYEMNIVPIFIVNELNNLPSTVKHIINKDLISK